MGLFSQSQLSEITAIAERSRAVVEPAKQATKTKSINTELNKISAEVEKYFQDSKSILITSLAQLHDYVTELIASGYCAIDTETTGLDRIRDYIVGASLYYPGGIECYIPIMHKVPIFEAPYANQLTYEEVASEFQRIVDAQVKTVWANADYDFAMIYKDMKVDFMPTLYFDVIHAWRVIKEDEPKKDLKNLYNKYVLKGAGNPKRFSDFFPPALFIYCKPEVAKLYAANDAVITFKLFEWQLPYLLVDEPKCQKHHFEKLADLYWNIELPMLKICQSMHRRGIYLDRFGAAMLHKKYVPGVASEKKALQDAIQKEIDAHPAVTAKRPFLNVSDFNPNSTPHVQWVVYDLLGLGADQKTRTTDKDVLSTFNHPVVKQILAYRSLVTLVSTFVEKLPNVVGPDHRIHCQFNSIGASTGRMCIAKGTPITVLNGYKNIEDLVPGDFVYCYDEAGELQLSPVKHVWLTGEGRACVKIRWQSSGSGDIRELICTPEHPILRKDGTWVRADQLQLEDKLALNQYIQSVKPCGKYDVYDIEVETYHNFIANEICVHNSSAAPNLQNVPSKHSDIRHMFRGSPSKEITLKCAEYEGHVSLILFKFSKLQKACNDSVEWTETVEFDIGDEVCLQMNDAAETAHIISIDALESDQDMYRIVFDIVPDESFIWKAKIITSTYVLVSSDYSQQEPKLTATLSQDEKMIQSFQEDKDIYSFIAALSFNTTYEACLENLPTGEYDEEGKEIKVYQPDGKARRSSAKSVVLGILYGRSIPSIADQLYSDKDWSDEEKVKQAQHVYDSVLQAFPALKKFMDGCQYMAHKLGYVETILGRRRHIPDMMLEDYDFEPLPGYVNPDVDPLNPATLSEANGIPKRVQAGLRKEFASYKYKGQIFKRIRQLKEDYHIKVVDNTYKKGEASRQCVNSAVQGSAAELTKMAMIKVEHDQLWQELGGQVEVPVHDELIGEVPIENYEAAGNRLSELMCDAASFLPFPIKCDVTTSYRWAGVEYPCKHKRPEGLLDLEDDEIRWIQYYLVDSGYYLPVFKLPNGDKPRGEEAVGINGKDTEEFRSFISDYMNRYNLTTDKEFLWHIEHLVCTGNLPNMEDFKKSKYHGGLTVS